MRKKNNDVVVKIGIVFEVSNRTHILRKKIDWDVEAN